MGPALDIQVLFQDSALLVINKPAGLATLPDGYNPSLPHIKSLLEQQYGPLWIVHRLDKNTSGVLLLARTADAHRSMNTQFEQHQVGKVYHALVVGNPGWKDRTVDLPLRPNGDRQHRTVIDPQHGTPAITHLRVLERLGQYCLLKAIPETGRTHQIRAHLSAIGLAILGDKLYIQRLTAQDRGTTTPVQGEHGPAVLFTEGIGLHARSLEITHPITGERSKFTAPYPDYWIVIVEQLRSMAAGE